MSTTITKTIISRRSPRLMEKEATEKITKVLADSVITGRWVFDDALFQKRWEHEQLKQQNEYSIGRGCHCHLCEGDAEQAERDFTEYLPYNNFTKDDVVPVIKALLDLSNQTKHPEMRLIYSVALFRLIHGPARCLLKFDNFRAMTKARCSSLPEQAICIGLIHTEFGERLANACWAVAEIIDQYEDQDGYNIFHGY
jgi:hypothetical protein